jgi:hypothetical protein
MVTELWLKIPPPSDVSPVAVFPLTVESFRVRDP